MKRLRLGLFTVVGMASALLPGRASAHFNLMSPPSWDNQAALGDPQKSAPCGQADPGTPAVASNVVTTYHPGDKVTITLSETIFHPGHYRVALANSQAELPADPQVTAGSTACGTTEIMATPAYPILADGALVHTTQFSGPQTIEVTLPANVTCPKCTLQIIEFMSNHGLNNPGGCFYHHCADIAIEAPIDTVPKDNGCSCAVAGPRASLAILLPLGFSAILALCRRRRGH